MDIRERGRLREKRDRWKDKHRWNPVAGSKAPKMVVAALVVVVVILSILGYVLLSRGFFS